MTHDKLIDRLRKPVERQHGLSRWEKIRLDRIEAADALTAAQNEIERLEGAFAFAESEMNTAAHVMSHFGCSTEVEAYQNAARIIREALQGEAQ